MAGSIIQCFALYALYFQYGLSRLVARSLWNVFSRCSIFEYWRDFLRRRFVGWRCGVNFSRATPRGTSSAATRQGGRQRNGRGSN
jgi:hypothetical protein